MLMPVKCLLVDDLEENLLALSALLQDDGVQLLTAASGAEALELLLVHDVALAFLDVQMPDMDGFELAELMRGSERTRHVPLIFVTAGVHEQQRVFKGYETGAVDFIYKPIEPHIPQEQGRGVFSIVIGSAGNSALELQDRTETLRPQRNVQCVAGPRFAQPLERDSRFGATAAEAHGRPGVAGHGREDSVERETDGADDRRHAGSRPRAPGRGHHRQARASDFKALVERVVREHQTAVPDRAIEFQHEAIAPAHGIRRALRRLPRI